jgi:hypothetical protein
MTPKEKARELIDRMAEEIAGFTGYGQGYGDVEISRGAALIAVDEIMLVVPYIDKDSIDLTLEQYRSSDNQFLNYWKAVREEINKL